MVKPKIVQNGSAIKPPQSAEDQFNERFADDNFQGVQIKNPAIAAFLRRFVVFLKTNSIRARMVKQAMLTELDYVGRGY
ncbi:MAG: hypothetical protein ACRCXT_23735, partial [Paraclostridium sp.]